MKKYSLIFIFLLSLSINGYSQSVTEKKQISKTTTSFSHALIYTSKKGQVCLLDKQTLGTTVTLLNLNSKSIFTCKTVSIKSEIDERGEKVTYTTLDKQPPKSEQENLSYTAILNAKTKDFKIIEAQSNKNQTYISDIDKKIKKEKYLEKIIRQNAELTPIQEYLDSLKLHLPVAYDILIDGKTINLIEYDNFMGNGSIGPRFLVINSKILPLSGQCSGTFFIYQLGNRYFINSPSTCCECGLNAQETFEIKGNLVKKIFSDYSYSN